MCRNFVPQEFFYMPVNLLTNSGNPATVTKDRNATIHNERVCVCIAMFAVTYVCEKLFSTMKIVKIKFRSRLTDKYLRDQLRLPVIRRLAVDFCTSASRISRSYLHKQRSRSARAPSERESSVYRSPKRRGRYVRMT
ncbi:hypothetical protein ANN_05954 [Periplaneta americana]|uniref:HAT C-terminal dimerisation domain-containing protein n=1 Tax=Periplaneta americana TaxID=6978 RepID=A0ABQ8TEP3_PERAM|nr:hypothetical protein ANN_05954 [Periplaneta americana]